MDRFHKPGFDGGDQRRVRVQRPVLADLAAQAQRFGIGRQDQFDGRGIEADAVVQALHAVFGIDALDGHHRHQDLDFRNLRRVAGEQRFDVMRRGRLDGKADPVGRDVHAGQHIDDLVDLGDDDAAGKGRGLGDGRRVFGIGAGVEIAVAVGRLRGHQRHARREVGEIAAEQLQVGMDGADVELAGRGQLGQAASLRAGEGKVQAVGDTPFEHVQMFRQGQHREQHVQAVHPCRVECGQTLGEEIRLLLVVALDTDTVTVFQHRIQQVGQFFRRGDLALQLASQCGGGACQPLFTVLLARIPHAFATTHLLGSHQQIRQ